MNFAQAPELADIRSAVRELCGRFPGEYWRALEPDRYPEEFVAALTEAGWLAALVPEEYGGGGLALTAASVILEEINATGCNSGACHAQMYTMGTVLRHGSRAQKERYLPRIASGELRLQAFGVTEPSVGSDTTSLQTTATRIDGGWVISGQKLWTSRAEHSDLMLLLARTTPADQVEKRTEGLSTFLVDMKRAVGDGTMTIRPIRTLMNHATTEIFLDRVVVEEEDLVGEEGRGFRYILDGMNAERVLIAAECIGDGRWFVDKATAYANERVVFGRPIGSNQGVQFPIARAHSQIEAADLVRYKAAWLYEQGLPCGAEANMAKLLAADASWAAANACLDTHGGFGFAEEYDVERKFRETRPDMATIAIGDIHGNLAALDDLLGQLKSEVSPGDVVVFLGDYIDRGPNTKECIDRVLALQHEMPGAVECLIGNHDDWLLGALRGSRQHTWLLATDAFKTIESYSADAARVLREAASRAGGALYGDDCQLPYEVFFDCVPADHIQFFESLRPYYQSSDCVCSHGGLDPGVASVQAQTRHALIWGAGGFPDKYHGQEIIMYGHRNNAVLNAEGWPAPKVVGRTIGIDTISHGVLTAMRMPDGRVFQSARYKTPSADV